MTDEQNPRGELPAADRPAEQPSEVPDQGASQIPGHGPTQGPSHAPSLSPSLGADDEPTRRVDPLPPTDDTATYPFGFAGGAGDRGYGAPGRSPYSFRGPTPAASGSTLTAAPSGGR